MNKKKLEDILNEMEIKDDSNNLHLSLELKWYLIRILQVILEDENN